MLGIAVAAIIHVLPIMAMFAAYFEFSQRPKNRPIQFGLPELLVMPLLVSPPMLTFIFLRDDRYNSAAATYVVMIYQFTFALAGWASSTKPGWDAAFRLLAGSYFGLFALLALTILIGILAPTLGLRP